MSPHDDFERSVARWFEAEARPAPTADVLDRALRATRQCRPRPRLYATLGSHWIGDGAARSSEARLWRTGMRTSTALVVLLLVLVVIAGAVAVGARLLRPAPADLGIFAPVAGRIVYADEGGVPGVDPVAPADPATRFELPSGAGIPLAWSRDGTRLLLMRGSGPDEHLSVLSADGSELQVTEKPWSIAGATLSPDGSRVVFASGSALYAVDVDGGSAEMLVGHAGSVRAPAYSPDGMHIAYTYGAGDHSHHVWVIRADGSDAHEIVYNERTAGAGHVHDLAWSPAGGQIALELEGSIYTFGTNGSDFKRIAGGDTTCNAADPCAVKLPKSAESPYWSPDGSRIAYTTGCADGTGTANRDGCHLAIAEADGSNLRTFGFAAAGPWHPAPIERPWYRQAVPQQDSSSASAD
jgi:WD40-like Beta Propeller Repeat